MGVEETPRVIVMRLSEVVVDHALGTTTSLVNRRSLSVVIFSSHGQKKVSLEGSVENPKSHPISQREGHVWKISTHQLNT